MDNESFLFIGIFVILGILFSGLVYWMEYDKTENGPKYIATAKEHAANWAKETSIEYKGIVCNYRGYCAINAGSYIIDIYCSPNKEKNYCYLNNTAR